MQQRKCELCQHLFEPKADWQTICDACENETCRECGELIEDCVCDEEDKA